MLPETITQWIRSVVVYMLLVSVMLHLLPDESYRKYVRIFVGLLLLLLVAQPVCAWLSGDSFSVSEDLLANILSEEQAETASGADALSDADAFLDEAQKKQEEMLLRAQMILSEKLEAVSDETDAAADK